MTRVNSYVKMNSRNISFHNYIDILTFWLPKSPVLVYKGISKIYKGKCGPSAFFIFFFEKNISDGQISRDCVPEAQTLLLTPISGYNDHYSKNGLNGHNRQNGHNWPNGQMAILAIMIMGVKRSVWASGTQSREIWPSEMFFSKKKMKIADGPYFPLYIFGISFIKLKRSAPA